MSNYQTLISKIETLIFKQGYAEYLDINNVESGYNIIKYFIDRSEKYKLGLAPEGNPLFSYLFGRMIYDGIAYEIYQHWHIRVEKNYYFFRYHYGKILDLSYISLISENPLTSNDSIFTRDFFVKIVKLVDDNLTKDFYFNSDCCNIYDNTYQELFCKLHYFGRCIALSWKEKKSARFLLLEDIINEQFNPFD